MVAITNQYKPYAMDGQVDGVVESLCPSDSCRQGVTISSYLPEKGAIRMPFHKLAKVREVITVLTLLPGTNLPNDGSHFRGDSKQ